MPLIIFLKNFMGGGGEVGAFTDRNLSILTFLEDEGFGTARWIFSFLQPLVGEDQRTLGIIQPAQSSYIQQQLISFHHQLFGVVHQQQQQQKKQDEWTREKEVI